MMDAPQGPRKLFREEAQTGAVSCPACGGPITLHGFGAVEIVNCPYCGSECSPSDSGELQLLQQAMRQRRQSALPLHHRCTFDGIEWELIGIVWRETTVDGVVYPWQEFLLFNPWHGYRYLVYTMTDGAWMIGGALDGAPKLESGLGHRRVSFKKDKYKHFQSSVAIVSYVEGEFPWQVHVGDRAMTHDYIAPPHCVSIEETASEDGQDVNSTRMRWIAREEVWKAFKLPGVPPLARGVGMAQPNPWRKGRALTWIMLAALLGLWVVASVIYVGGRSNKVIFQKNGVTELAPISEEIEVAGNGKTTLEFELHAKGLSNAWAYVDVMLVAQDSEDAIGFGATAEEWHGVDGGESWTEGNTNPTVTVGGVPAGKYLLQITPSAGQEGAAAEVPPTGLVLDMRLEQDVVLLRYLLIPFFIIFGFPILYWILALVFEGRRWQNSDYASSG
jgi:hypothetical protein